MDVAVDGAAARRRQVTLGARWRHDETLEDVFWGLPCVSRF